MKLKDYALVINALKEQNPDAEVIYSKDDEGNAFHSVVFLPIFGDLTDGEFIPQKNKKYICIN